jgi:hypothetical protein
VAASLPTWEVTMLMKAFAGACLQCSMVALRALHTGGMVQLQLSSDLSMW